MNASELKQLFEQKKNKVFDDWIVDELVPAIERNLGYSGAIQASFYLAAIERYLDYRYSLNELLDYLRDNGYTVTYDDSEDLVTIEVR